MDLMNELLAVPRKDYFTIKKINEKVSIFKKLFYLNVFCFKHSFDLFKTWLTSADNALQKTLVHLQL